MMMNMVTLTPARGHQMPLLSSPVASAIDGEVDHVGEDVSENDGEIVGTEQTSV